MNDELINRGDAIAIAMHSKDPVEGIKNLPAVDAVEVVHAKWLWFAYDKAWTKCSNCKSNWKWKTVKEGHMDYCPNCGARMDGE